MRKTIIVANIFKIFHVAYDGRHVAERIKLGAVLG